MEQKQPENLTKQIIQKINFNVNDVNNPEIVDLITYIMGENPYKKVLFNPNDIASLVEAIDKNKDTLFIKNTKSLSVEEIIPYRTYQMNILFGDDWQSHFQNQLIQNAEQAIIQLKNKLEYTNNPDNKSLNTNDQNYEFVSHPSHYNNYGVETIQMMEKIFGIQPTIDFCILSAFKYRMRMGSKPGESLNRDLDKEKFYLDYANILKQKLNQ